jgi:hypothetical protein
MKKFFAIAQAVCAVWVFIYGIQYFTGVKEFDNVTVAMYAWALGLVGFVDAFRK